MKDKALEKLGKRGLLLIAVSLIIGAVCLIALGPKEAVAGILIPFAFGTIAATPTEALSRVRTIQYTHNAPVAAYEPIVVGNNLIIALNAKDADVANTYMYMGRVVLPKKAGLALTEFAIAYWDSDPGEITDVSTAHKMAGFVITKAAAEDTEVEIFLFPDLTNIGAAEIANGAVDTDQLAAKAVTTAKIDDLAVDTGQIAADAIDGTKVEDDAISLEHLDAGITPGAICFFAGTKTTAGGNASEDIAVEGMLETDTVMVSIQDDGTNNVTLKSAVAKAGSGAITCVFSGDPAADCDINVLVFRAAA